MVHAVHFYDGLTMMTKHWNRVYNVDVIGVLRGKYFTPAFALKVGETAIRNCLRDQLKFLREESLKYMGSHPLIFTEIGIPYDMDDKYAYKTGNYSSQTSAMDANHYALEGSGSNGFTQWLYTTNNDHEWGDQWNGEDLSIFSADDRLLPSGETVGLSNESSPAFSESQCNVLNQQVGPQNLKHALASPSISSGCSQMSDKDKLGYRAAEAYIRPSPVYTNGKRLSHGFDLRSCTFTLSLMAKEPTSEDAPTEIYLPDFHFPDSSTVVAVSDGKWTLDREEVNSVRLLCLRWWHGKGNQDIKIQGLKRKPGEFANPRGSEDVSYLEQCQRGGCSVM